MDPKFIFDDDQAKALRGVIGAAHPYKAVVPNRWTKPAVPKPQDPPFYPKPSIGTMDGVTSGIPGLGAQDQAESPHWDANNSGPGQAPAERQHIYHLILDEIQNKDYAGKYTIFNGIEQDIIRAIRIPYTYYKSTGNGGALLVKDYITVLFEGGAGH